MAITHNKEPGKCYNHPREKPKNGYIYKLGILKWYVNEGKASFFSSGKERIIETLPETTELRCL